MEQKHKNHTTNYFNTFIEVAEDCPVLTAEIPASKGDKESIARMQYELISKHPYSFTSDDILFQVYAKRNDLTEPELEEARKHLFSKGQACMRASPLTKRYGWGIHNNAEGKIALYGLGTEEYEKMKNDPEQKVLKAVRSKKAER